MQKSKWFLSLAFLYLKKLTIFALCVMIYLTGGIMTEKSIEILKQFGFKPYCTNCDLLSAFKKPAYGLDTQMIVQGDHADDIAELIYACEDDFKGFCYAPSILEAIMINYPKKHNIDKVLKKLEKVGIFVELKFVGIFPMVVLPCDEKGLESPLLKFDVSDMLKVVGILDYLLQQRLEYLDKQRKKYGDDYGRV